MSRFIDELKHRNVFRAAILYVGAAWVILQVVDVVGQILKWPDSIGQFVLLALAAGFPVAMLLSWFFQFTASGIHAESDAADSTSTTVGARRQSDKVIIAVLAFAVTLFVAIEIYKRIEIENVQHLVDLGQQQLMIRNESSVVEAAKYFELAIEKNENFAPAYAGLAETLVYQFIWELKPAADARVEIQAAIDKGLDLDHEIGALYASQGALKWEHDNDFDAAETFFLQAIELSPDDSLGYRWYAEFLILTRGSWEEALPQLEKGLELVPNDPSMVRWYALAKRNLDEGVEALPKLLESLRHHSDYLGNYVEVAQILNYEQGRIGESLKWAQHISKADSENFRRRFELECWAWLLFQEIDEVRKCTRKLEEDFEEFPKKTMIARFMYYHAVRDENKISEEVNALMQLGPAETIMQRDSENSQDVTDLLGGMIPDVLVDLGMWDLARSFKEWQKSPVFADPDWKPSKDDVGSTDDILGAVINGAILYETGDQERGNRLFELALDRIKSEDLGDEAGYSFRQILILAVQGDKRGAEAYLRVNLVDKLHLEDWFRLQNPVFELVADDPEWKKLLAGLEARAAAELARYEKNKDEPLFNPL